MVADKKPWRVVSENVTAPRLQWVPRQWAQDGAVARQLPAGVDGDIAVLDARIPLARNDVLRQLHYPGSGGQPPSEHAAGAPAAAASREVPDDVTPTRPRPRGLVYELMPLIWTLRFMLMLPVSILPNGTFRFRWLSVPMAVTAVSWAGLVTIAYLLVRHRLAPVSDDKLYHVWDLVPKYASSVGLSYMIVLPYSSWATTGSAVKMIEQWQKLEASIWALDGQTTPPRLRARAWLYSVVCVGVPLLLQGAGLYLLPDDRPWMLPALVHSISYLMLGTIFWHLSCNTLAFVATNQAEAMARDLDRLGVPGLLTHRQIWLDLVKVVNLLSYSWGRTQSLLLGTFFLAFTSISFLLTHMVLARALDRKSIWLGISFVLVITAILSICNAAQTVTDAVRMSTAKQLLFMSLKTKDPKTSLEINTFLHDIRLEMTDVSVCGLAILGRSSILSLFALASTYIVVLSQFSISVEEIVGNFSEGDGILEVAYD